MTRATPISQQPGDDRWAPDEFIDHLAAGWRLGDVDAFIAHFQPSFHPDVKSTQPWSSPQIGFAALEKQFREIFAFLPDVTADITSWAAAEPNVYVEFEITAGRRGRPFVMRSCDRFTITEGMITERSVYFDPTVVFRFITRHPRLWPSLVRRHSYRVTAGEH